MAASEIILRSNVLGILINRALKILHSLLSREFLRYFFVKHYFVRKTVFIGETRFISLLEFLMVR